MLCVWFAVEFVLCFGVVACGVLFCVVLVVLLCHDLFVLLCVGVCLWC